MRILEAHGLGGIADSDRVQAMAEDCNMVPEGEDTYTFNLPAGFVFHSELQPNSSTSINIYNSSGNSIFFWNSGTYMSCALIGGGVGLLITSFTRNPRLGSLAGTLTSMGCTKAINSTLEDGDAYIPPC
jgi:hypothetical protein